jgi:putative protease
VAEIAEIRNACPDIELEVFVHGALCIAYSGRCLLSGYLNHRDANQGTCTNACRWRYRVGRPQASPADGDGDHAREVDHRHPDADRVWLLEEAQRPGEYLPVFEDEHGTYILNAKDLRAVVHVAELTAMGIDCLKIEGRTKSHYYTARATQVYRRAIDDAVAGRPFRDGLLADLDGLANRGYTEGFFRRHAPAELQSYQDGSSRSQRQVFVGEVTGQDPDTGLAEIEVRNRFAVGDRLELMTPRGNHRFALDGLWAPDGTALTAAPGDGWRVRVRLPKIDTAMGLLARQLSG